jgi:hypothetical protein
MEAETPRFRNRLVPALATRLAVPSRIGTRGVVRPLRPHRMDGAALVVASVRTWPCALRSRVVLSESQRRRHSGRKTENDTDVMPKRPAAE